MKQDGAPKKPKPTKKRVSDKPKTKVKTETSKKAKVSTSTTASAPAPAEQSAAKSNAVAEQPAAAPVITNQTMAQPIAQPALPPQMAMGQRKSKAGLIIAICAAVLVVLLAIAGATAYAFYQKPENVLLDAVSKLPLATKVSTKTTVNSNFSYEADGVNIKFKKFTFDTGAENTPKFDANAELVLEVNGKELSLKASGLVTDNGTVYFKDNIVSSIKETLSILHQKLPAQAEKHLKKIDGKWVKYSLADARKQDKKSANQLQCVIDAYKKYSKDDKAKHQISSVYKKHPFIIIDEEVKSQNGNFGYDVSVDDDKAEAFWKDFRETSFAKSVESCAPNVSSSSDTYKSAKKAKSKAAATMTVWVSQWSHELRGVDVKATNLKTDSRSDKNYNVSAKTVIDFSKGSQVAVPGDAISAEEWARAISQSFQSVSGGSYLSSPTVDADNDLEYGDYDD
ncbi:hypothetical protein HG431_001775 [Candidatus Saccharibacteria bacterium]|nr:hypothetical protein [Candidatus Saccharibacteria bacterium]